MSETEVKKEAEAVEEQKSVVNKDAVPAEKSPLKNDAEDLGSAVTKPTDSNPDATKKAKKVSDQVNKDAKDGSLPNDQKPAGMKEEETEVEGEEIAEDKEESTEMNIDLSDDVKALVSTDADLSEEFKEKAATIFESAVKTKVRAELEKIQEQNDQLIEEMAESTINDMTEKVDDYLNYVVEQWMEENQLAIERGLKGEIAEDFISGLKNLFEDHYIDVPDEKYDILEANLTKIEELEEKLNKQMDENIQLRKQKGELVKESMISDVADGMTDTETEKFQSLVEDVEFSDEESYKEKLQTIRESYFGSSTAQVLTEEGSIEDNTPTESVEVSDKMSKYLKAIGRDHKAAQK